MEDREAGRLAGAGLLGALHGCEDSVNSVMQDSLGFARQPVEDGPRVVRNVHALQRATLYEWTRILL